MNADELGDVGQSGLHQLILAISEAHAKGDLVSVSGLYGFTESTCDAGGDVMLDLGDKAYYCPKTTGSDTHAVGATLEVVAAGEGATTMTARAHSAGVKALRVTKASVATEDGVWVVLEKHLYLAHD